MGIQDVESGIYWYPYGRTSTGARQIGTWQPVTTGTLTLHYEAHMPTIAIASADAALAIPDDWAQAVTEYVLWHVMERVGRMGDAMVYRKQYLDAVGRLRANELMLDGTRQFTRGTQF